MKMLPCIRAQLFSWFTWNKNPKLGQYFRIMTVDIFWNFAKKIWQFARRKYRQSSRMWILFVIKHMQFGFCGLNGFYFQRPLLKEDVTSFQWCMIHIHSKNTSTCNVYVVLYWLFDVMLLDKSECVSDVRDKIRNIDVFVHTPIFPKWPELNLPNLAHVVTRWPSTVLGCFGCIQGHVTSPSGHMT